MTPGPGSVRLPDVHVRDGLVVDRTTAARILLVDDAVMVPLARELDASRSDADLLSTGSDASFALISGPARDRRPSGTLIVAPRDLVALVLEGELIALDGAPTVDAGSMTRTWVGDWTDAARSMTQHLRADGRYSETRSGVRDAWTGRFWGGARRIVYLDDSGFWAFGERDRDREVIRHADFVLVEDGSAPGTTRRAR